MDTENNLPNFGITTTVLGKKRGNWPIFYDSELKTLYGGTYNLRLDEKGLPILSRLNPDEILSILFASQKFKTPGALNFALSFLLAENRLPENGEFFNHVPLLEVDIATLKKIQQILAEKNAPEILEIAKQASRDPKEYFGIHQVIVHALEQGYFGLPELVRVFNAFSYHQSGKRVPGIVFAREHYQHRGKLPFPEPSMPQRTRMASLDSVVQGSILDSFGRPYVFPRSGEHPDGAYDPGSRSIYVSLIASSFKDRKERLQSLK